MDTYFVRVYMMTDGSKHESAAIYETYDQAVEAIARFNPSGEGVDDLSNVSYVQVEKRFSPTPVWDNH
jgi:hypothetical protein